MSAADVPEELWNREPPPPTPPAWWSRRARFSYGLLILGIGWAGEAWATNRGDASGHALSRMLLLLAGGVMAAAVLAPVWPTLASALMPVRRAAATWWRPISSSIGTVVDRAGRLSAAMWPPVAAAVERSLAAIARLTAAAWRPLSSAAAAFLIATGHHIAKVWPPVAARSGKALTRVGRLMAAIVRPVATAIRAVLTATGHLIAAAWRAVISAIRAVLTATGQVIVAVWRAVSSTIRAVLTFPGHLIAAAWRAVSSATITIFATAGRVVAAILRPVASSIETVLTATGQLIGATWRPIRSSIAKLLTAAADVAANAWPRLVAAAATAAEALTPIGHGVVAAWRPVWSTLARGTAGSRHFITTAWATQRARISKALTPAATGLLVVELAIVGVALGFSSVWGWWLDGERMTGIVVESADPVFSPAGEMTIRDRFSDNYTDVAVAFGLGAIEVGDAATVVVRPSDASQSATPATLAFYLALWMTLPLAALAWPVLWRRRCRQRWLQTWGPRVSHAPPRWAEPKHLDGGASGTVVDKVEREREHAHTLSER